MHHLSLLLVWTLSTGLSPVQAVALGTQLAPLPQILYIPNDFTHIHAGFHINWVTHLHFPPVSVS